MRRIFISHPYSDIPRLRKQQVDHICRSLSGVVLPISPLHLFSFEKDDSKREEILEVCYDLIDICDEFYIFEYNQLSKGQMNEVYYANKSDIWIEFLNPPKKCVQMENEWYKYSR